jgi:hypothetical protein
MRIGAPPEITLFEIIPSTKNAGGPRKDNR